MLNVAKKFVDHTGSLKLAKLLATLFVHPILRKIPNFRKYIFDNLSWAILPLKTRHHKYPFLPRYHVTFFLFWSGCAKLPQCVDRVSSKKAWKVVFFDTQLRHPCIILFGLEKNCAKGVFDQLYAILDRCQYLWLLFACLTTFRWVLELCPN